MNNSYLKYAFILVCIVFAQLWGGTLSSLQNKVVLQAKSSPWIINRSLAQKPSDTLIIEAGTKIIIDGYHKIYCQGTVIVNGSPTHPVEISTMDSTDSWIGMDFNTGSNTLAINYLVVNNAFRNVLNGSVGYIKNTVFRNGFYGLQLRNHTGIKLESLLFEGNRYALDVRSNKLFIDKSKVENNAFAFFEAGGFEIVGEDNIWQKDEKKLDSSKVKIPQHVLEHIESRF
ncbi:MAG: hypothetical protein GX801_02475 [Fibrobacter sp.]|nr:hypothetical protein [Fibrobacter sp.]